MENTTIGLKGIFAIFTGLAAYLLNCVTELVIVLIWLMFIDYITGVTAAFVRKDLESRKSFIGAIKKIGYMVLLALAFFVDYLISYFVNKVGLVSPISGLFGVATACWLIGTEGLSILENLHVIGVPFPPFLKSAFRKIQDESGNFCKIDKKG